MEAPHPQVRSRQGLVYAPGGKSVYGISAGRLDRIWIWDFHRVCVSFLCLLRIAGFKKKEKPSQEGLFFYGTPDAIRTHGLWSRSPTLYPAELRAHTDTKQYTKSGTKIQSVKFKKIIKKGLTFLTGGGMIAKLSPRGADAETKITKKIENCA